MAARLTDNCKVSHAATVVGRSLDERSGRPRSFRNCGYFVSGIALKSEVIEWLADQALLDNNHELRILAGRGSRTEPDRAATLASAVTDNIQTTYG